MIERFTLERAQPEGNTPTTRLRFVTKGWKTQKVFCGTCFGFSVFDVTLTCTSLTRLKEVKQMLQHNHGTTLGPVSRRRSFHSKQNASTAQMVDPRLARQQQRKTQSKHFTQLRGSLSLCLKIILPYSYPPAEQASPLLCCWAQSSTSLPKRTPQSPIHHH